MDRSLVISYDVGARDDSGIANVIQGFGGFCRMHKGAYIIRTNYDANSVFQALVNAFYDHEPFFVMDPKSGQILFGSESTDYRNDVNYALSKIWKI